MRRVTDAKFEMGEEREATTGGGGVRGGEVERKIQRCREKLTDAAIEWEVRGKGWVVRGYGLVSFLCIWMWIEAVGVGAAGKGEAELG